MLSRQSADPHVHSRLLNLLQSPEATSVLLELLEMNPTPSNAIGIVSALRKRYPADVVAAGMTLHELRNRATGKFSQAPSMFFTRAGYEQATSELIAVWRARRYQHIATVADLCSGIGGDLVALAQQPGIERLIAVDLDPDHLTMAVANAALYAPSTLVDARLDDVRNFNLAGIDAIFIDPARRDRMGRLGVGETMPPLDWCLELSATVDRVGIKLAPGLAHDRVPPDWELELIANGTDLKEAVLWSPAMATTAARATVVTPTGVESMTGEPDDMTNIPDDHSIVEPRAGMWLHDPNPAVTRAGLVRTLAEYMGATSIDDQIAFLVTPESTTTPFARSRRIIASEPWNEKNLRRTLRTLDVGPVDIRRRGLAGDVDAITKRLRGSGRRPVWIAMTRLHNRPWAIVADNRDEI